MMQSRTKEDCYAINWYDMTHSKGGIGMSDCPPIPDHLIKLQRTGDEKAPNQIKDTHR
jgi:hypothetical protein